MPPSSKDSVPISKILKICTALEFLCCCVCLHQSWPIACTLVKRGEYSLSHDTQFSGMNLFITYAHDQSVVRHWHDNQLSILILKHEYPDIVNWYEELSKKFPEIVKFVPSIGKSVDGRDMPAVHITASSADALKIYFQCQIHASKSPCCVGSFHFALGCLATVLLFIAGEGISGATCNYIASFLTENYDKNEEVTLTIN